MTRGKGSRQSARRLRSQAQGSQGPTPALHPPPSLPALPEEIWRQIFLLCLPSEEFIHPSRTSAPLLLCQVCGAWRASAIDTPDLWASISIGSDLDALGRFPRLELIKLWLSRAKTFPLSISFGRYPLEDEFGESWHEDDLAEGEIHEIFLVLFRHIAQWKSFRLCPGEIVQDPLPFIPDSGAPILRKLCLFFPPGPIEYDEYAFSSCHQSLCDIWRNSTLLDTFSVLADNGIINEGGDSLRTLFQIRWAQLTTLKITTALNITQCLEFLKECPILVDCAFHSIYLYDDDNLSTLYPTSILLTSLQSLSLQNAGFTTLRRLTELLLANTTMPALRRLALNSLKISSSGSFAAFILRSSCHIEDLTLYAFVMSDAGLLQFLEILSQTLVRLCIQYHGPGSRYIVVKCMSDAVIQRLTRDKSTSLMQTTLCPKLESIDLDYRAVKARDGLFSKMVSSRCGMEEHGITALKKVVLRFGDETGMNRVLDVGALKLLREEGVLGELSIEMIGCGVN